MNLGHELRRLNPEQAKAVNTIFGPTMVFAGAGTGKTQVLALRIAKMISKDIGILPGNILALTHTNSGVAAMRERLFKLVGADAYRVGIYTIHAFCDEIIRSHPHIFGASEMEPATDLEIINVIRKLIDNLDDKNPLKRLRGDKYYDVPRLINLFNTIKTEGWDIMDLKIKIDDYINSLPLNEDFQYKRANAKRGIQKGDINRKKVSEEIEKLSKFIAATELFSEYQTEMRSQNLYDFNDMLSWVQNAFKVDGALLEDYQERYQYVLVDEFQDTSGSQTKILDLLMSFWDNPNIFVVGDHRQGIYGFAGAHIGNIISFREKYNPEVIGLNKNYRSTQEVLDVAKNLIDNNGTQVDNYLSEAGNFDIKFNPRVTACKNPDAEAEYISGAIKYLLSNGENPSDIAVIYRKHKHSESIIKLLKDANINITIQRKANVLHDPYVRQLLTTLRFVSECNNRNVHNKYLFELLHYKCFGINQELIHENYTKFSGFELINRFSEISESFKKFIWIIGNRFDVSLMEFIINLMDVSIFKEVLSDEQKGACLISLRTLIDFIKDSIRKNPNSTIESILNDIDAMEHHDLSLQAYDLRTDANGVNFVTAHAAKGLEWKHVFIIGANRKEWEKARTGMNQFYIPSIITLTTDEDQFEASRRLFYVAVTRAKQMVNVTYSKHTNEGKDIEPSQFLAELGNVDWVDFQESGTAEQLCMKSVVPFKVTSTIAEQFLTNYIFSAAHMNRVIECPISYYYDKVLKVPYSDKKSIVAGNTIHHVMDIIYSQYMDSKLGLEMVIDLANLYITKRSGLLSAEDIQDVRGFVNAALTKYYPIYHNAQGRVLTEYRVKDVEINGIPVTAVIDKLEMYDDCVDIVDYKTGSPDFIRKAIKSPDASNPLGGIYWRELMFHKLALESIKSKNFKVRDIYIEEIGVDGSIRTKLDIDGYDDVFMKMMTDAYETIINLKFTDGCGDENCRWCNFLKELK